MGVEVTTRTVYRKTTAGEKNGKDLVDEKKRRDDKMESKKGEKIEKYFSYHF